MKMFKKLAAVALVGALIVGGAVVTKEALDQPPLTKAPVALDQPPLTAPSGVAVVAFLDQPPLT